MVHSLWSTTTGLTPRGTAELGQVESRSAGAAASLLLMVYFYGLIPDCEDEAAPAAAALREAQLWLRGASFDECMSALTDARMPDALVDAVREVLLKVVYSRMGGPNSKPTTVPLFSHPYYWAGWVLAGAGGAVFGMQEAMESKQRAEKWRGQDVDSDDECFGRAALAQDARAQVEQKKKQLAERVQQAKRKKRGRGGRAVHPSPDDDDGGGGSDDAAHGGAGEANGASRVEKQSKTCVVQ